MAVASALPSVAALLLLATPPVSLAQNNNSYATMLQHNAMWQANLTKQMINLGGKVVGSGAGGGPAPCMPPYELQRGADGHVPPELQGDPRYQEYLRCQRLQPGPPLDGRPAAGPAVPAPAAAQHLPITATDFVPAQPGHPVVDQAIVGMAITPQQRIQLRQAADAMFNRVASQYRGNNLAVSVTVAYAAAMAALNGSMMTAQQTRDLAFAVNDTLGRHPQFAQMSALQKQNESDRLLFQSLVVSLLSEMGQRDPQARQQAMQFARALLKQLNVAA
jgi:hypothetical protein